MTDQTTYVSDIIQQQRPEVRSAESALASSSPLRSLTLPRLTPCCSYMATTDTRRSTSYTQHLSKLFNMSYDRIASPSHQTMYVHSPLPVQALIHSRSQADDEDLDSLSFTHPQASGSTTQPPPLAGPSSAVNGGVSGKIGSDGLTKPSTSRTGWGGVKMETRYTGASTLDEPVSATIVSLSARVVR